MNLITDKRNISDFSVSPSPFGLDFGTLDLGLTINQLLIFSKMLFFLP